MQENSLPALDLECDQRLIDWIEIAPRSSSVDLRHYNCRLEQCDDRVACVSPVGLDNLEVMPG